MASQGRVPIARNQREQIAALTRRVEELEQTLTNIIEEYFRLAEANLALGGILEDMGARLEQLEREVLAPFFHEE